jgi:hypothetical protein
MAFLPRTIIHGSGRFGASLWRTPRINQTELLQRTTPSQPNMLRRWFTYWDLQSTSVDIYFCKGRASVRWRLQPFVCRAGWWLHGEGKAALSSYKAQDRVLSSFVAKRSARATA